MKTAHHMLALLLLGALTACSNSGTEENEADGLRVTLLDAGQKKSISAQATQIGLLSVDAAGQLQPGLAQSWRVSNDGRSYIFRLNHAQWQDGRAISAGDVVAVLRRAVAPGSDHPLKPYLMAIDQAPAVARNRKPQRMLGVDDPREDIVEVQLRAPMPEFLRLLALPEMAIARKGPNPPAAGPYLLRSDAKARLHLVRNSDYKLNHGRALSSPLILTQASDANSALQILQAGKTDVLIGGGVDGLGAARTAGPGTQLVLEPSYGLYGYVARTIDGPLSDVRVRRALSLALDRPALIARLFSMPAIQATSLPVPPAVLEESQSDVSDSLMAGPLAARRAQAQALLRAAGFGPDHPLQLDVALPNVQIHRDILAVVAQNWAPLGVSLNIHLRNPQQHADNLTRGGFDLALVDMQAPVALVPMFLEPYRCQRALGGYCNPAADQWLDAGWDSPTLVARNKAWQQAIALHAAEVPIIALFQPVRWHMSQQGMSGLQANIYGQHPLAALMRTDKRNALLKR